jgi:hypothetical protein
MWMVDTKLLCRKHLLGEHLEIHKFKHSFEKQHSMTKRIQLGQIAPTEMETRHEDIVKEMIKRGYNHQSPYTMPDISYIKEKDNIDIDKNILDLMNRCEDCKKRIEGE